MKKVLGLVVSNRKLGNSEILVKEIMGNIPEECNRELIRLTDLEIKPCKACYRCLQPDNACPVRDDFNFVIGKIVTQIFRIQITTVFQTRRWTNTLMIGCWK